MIDEEHPRCGAKNRREPCTREADFYGSCRNPDCGAATDYICTECVSDATARPSWTCSLCLRHGGFEDVYELTPLRG